MLIQSASAWRANTASKPLAVAKMRGVGRNHARPTRRARPSRAAPGGELAAEAGDEGAHLGVALVRLLLHQLMRSVGHEDDVARAVEEGA